LTAAVNALVAIFENFSTELAFVAVRTVSDFASTTTGAVID
jgi:hypothetical protein